MPDQQLVVHPTDIIYHYDGTLPGFFCCVYESVYGRQMPAGIQPEPKAEFSLFDQMWIDTDAEKAARVRRSIGEKISPSALRLIEDVYLSCLENKELHMLRFLLKGYATGPAIMKMIGDEVVSPLFKADRHLKHEAHQLTGFIRFSDYDGALAATITPKNFVLPYLAGHFVARYRNENFMIYDKNHQMALVYQDRKKQLIRLENITFPKVSETEKKYRKMWKMFYDTIAIEARDNPRCRMTHMPKRFWENMTEFAEEED